MYVYTECPQEESSVFCEFRAPVILSKKVYMYVSYSERFPRESYVTVQYTVHCTDEQHAMSSQELRWNFRKCVTLGKLYQLCHLNNKYRH
jgi:hypothetical protein